MLSNYICALDIGSSKISACLAQFQRRRLSRIFFDTIPAKGTSDGLVVDSISLVNCVSKILKGLRAKSGINIKYVYTNISGLDILTKHSRAIIPLAERGNKVITAVDIQLVNEQARILGSSLEEEIVQQVPYSYTIDSKANIANPLGLYSHRLEVDLYLICAKLSNVQSLVRVISQSGYEIKDLFFSGLVSAKGVFNKEQKVGLNIFCDVGSDIAEILIFKNGNLYDMEILPLGGNTLTERLSDELKIPFELAEDIKRSHGIVSSGEEIKEDKEILVKKTNLYKPIKQKMVCQLITSAARDVSGKIKDALEKKISRYEVDSFVTVGRTVLLEGFIEMLENTLGIPVKLGRITNPELAPLVKEQSDLSGQKYLTYLTALGILCEVLEEKPPEILPALPPAKNFFFAAINKFKEVYQEYF
jgi:cell division protein FtsA